MPLISCDTDGVRKIQLRDGLGELADLVQNAGKQSVKFLALAAGRHRTQLHKIGELNRSAQLEKQALIVVAVRMRNVARQRGKMLVDQSELEGHGARIGFVGEQADRRRRGFPGASGTGGDR